MALLAVGVAVVVLVLVGSGGATRGPLESMFQDDAMLIYNPSAASIDSRLATLRSLGVDRLRLTVKWSDIAPAAGSRTPPTGFDATDPAAYGAGWGRYDRIVLLAARHHLAVDFNLTGPGPLWATAPNPPDPHVAPVYGLSPAAFREFVVAVGRRYSGRYTVRAAGHRPVTLPRVSFWTVWNEPNQPGWLAPQWHQVDGRREPAAPVLYRAYVDAAYSALRATGHGSDRFLIGELAPEGCVPGGAGQCFYTSVDQPITPLPFVQALYCLDGTYVPLRGAAAPALGCPTRGGRGAFVRAHPGLFRASAFAHHPYSFFLAPGVSLPPPFVPLADLGRLERSLDRVFAAYGLSRRLPLYLTEYGYETNPPDPTPRGMTLGEQAAYLNQATYMAARDPRVEGLSQFLLVDSPPDLAYPPGNPKRWATFQTGLEFVSGQPKPSLAAYRLPIFIARAHVAAGGDVGLWAMLRTAPSGSDQHATIQWRPPGGAFRSVAQADAARRTRILTASVHVPGSGEVRVRWVSPAGRVELSRAVAVLVR